ncbi:MAG TPA: FtsX-like permease family protein [Gemmatimonadaceae bacterium]|nr:FtsX-like permease family protein [Gemmatimonadaceae bacterium]
MSSRFAGLAAVAWRESRTARRRLLLYMSSITLGVAALVAIDAFAENATDTVHDQSRALLGGDLALNARDTFSTPVVRLFDSLSRTGYGIARQTTLASMAVGRDTTALRLVQLRAVTPDYPFFGDIETDPPSAWAELQRGPNAIVDASLLVALNSRVGDTLSFGTQRFIIRGTIASVPGEVAVTATVGPRVYIPERYLRPSGLLVFGSRAEYEAVVRLPSATSADQFTGRFGPFLARHGVRERTVAQNEANLSEAIDQLRDFLSVVGLVALFLGGIGVASGVHAFVMGKIDTVAVLRCVGATSWQVVIIYVLQAAAMGTVGAAVGALLGVAAQFSLPHVLRDYLPPGVVARFAPHAVLVGLGLGLWVALVFALRPLLALRRISPLQALRREADSIVLRRVRRDSSAAVVSIATVASVFALTMWRTDDLREGLWFGVAILVAVGGLWVVASLLTATARHAVRPGWPFTLRQAVASLHRPGNQTQSVILSLGFGVFLMSTLYQARSTLLHRLDIRIAQLRANVVFFDVQGSQADGVDSTIRADGDQLLQRIPIIAVRLASINGRRVDSAGAGGFAPGNGGRGRPGAGGGRFYLRDIRATYSDTIDAGETLAAGRWFGPRTPGDTVAEVSLDSTWAPRMHIHLGDLVTWTVQGVPVATRVTSLRTVDRTRIQPSFPVVFSPHSLDAAPAQFVFLANAPGTREVALLQRDIVRRYPTVSSLDLALVQHTINDVLAKITGAVRFMALLSLILAVPVLFSAVAATRRERLREGVLLKTLGATKGQVGRMMLAEYLMLGALGSLTGVTLSIGGAWALLHYVFKASFTPALGAAAMVSAAMTVVVLAVGVLTSRDVFATTPMAALREV